MIVERLMLGFVGLLFFLLFLMAAWWDDFFWAVSWLCVSGALIGIAWIGDWEERK